MRNILGLVSAVILAGSLSVSAAEPAPKDSAATTPDHSADAMAAGHHMMPANKHEQMKNKAMPGMNPRCSEAALAKMPAEHRAACHT